MLLKIRIRICVLRPKITPLGNAVVKSTEYTELQPLLSGVHSVMRVKLALAGKGGGARPPPFTTLTLTSKVAVYDPAEWADTLTLFHHYQYTVCSLWLKA